MLKEFWAKLSIAKSIESYFRYEADSFRAKVFLWISASSISHKTLRDCKHDDSEIIWLKKQKAREEE